MPYFELAADWKSIVMEAIRPEIERKAKAGLDAAREIAPVHTGAYRESLHLQETPGGYALSAGTDHALEVEYGNRHQHAHHPLLHAADVIKRS